MNDINFKENYTLKKGLLLIISGPSGAGKSAVCKEYIKRYPETLLSISETTRKKRAGEKEGREYFFVNQEVFLERQKQGYYLESAGNYENYYGTPKDPVLQALANGKDVILEIDPKGALQVREKIPEAILVFVLPATRENQERQLKGRNSESQNQMDIRLGETEAELAFLPEYNFVLINEEDRLKETSEKLRKIFDAERYSVFQILNQQ